MSLEGTPMIEGTWTNKKTGKRIQVRDSIIDGDDMLLITTEGQITMEEFSRDYIQVSEEYYDENKNVINDSETLKKIEIQEKEAAKPNIGSLIATDVDDNFFNKLQKKQQTTAASTIQIDDYEQPKPKKQKTQKSTNFDLLDKLFRKVKVEPHFDVFECKNFPSQQLQMLKDFYDVTDDEIAEYMINYVFMDYDLKKIIIDYLEEEFDKK